MIARASEHSEFKQEFEKKTFMHSNAVSSYTLMKSEKGDQLFIVSINRKTESLQYKQENG